MAIWQYTFWIDYKWDLKEIINDLKNIFWDEIEENKDINAIILGNYQGNNCSIFFDNSKILEIFCRLDLREKNGLERNLLKLKELSEKYNLKFLVWKEYIWEKELDYDNFVKELYNSSNMKFVEWNYWEIFDKSRRLG